MNRKFSITITGLALAAALGLAGCGGAAGTSGSSAATGGTASSAQAADASPSSTPTPDTPSATELYPKMKAAVKAATSVKVSGTASSGQFQKIEFAGNRAGTNLAMTLTTSQGTAQVRIVDKTAYVKGDQKFWSQAGAGSAAAKLVGKWVKAPSTSSFKGANMNEVLDDAFKKDPTAAELKSAKVEEADLDGVKAYKLSDVDGSSDGAIWVAADGEPYPLRITSSKAKSSASSSPSAGASSSSASDLRLSQWNAVPKVAAPAASEIVSIPGQG
ncbi:hypothetical protein GCM10011512_23520 [Tersicoccus solisilvae]|uniref:LppX_LprAFG lipoprotein n=1 Tax=Tersicoccus solisilvae TaxID=1882339 RepID=A0ABQ1PEQ6_9MICC|nr:hypothetical protein [Tersicoccus solisilvae]GGC95777.1 hypothetical protein GCM10011512_23520 [Tersicoccus solisilvae]